jgi:hypothetical protein
MNARYPFGHIERCGSDKPGLYPFRILYDIVPLLVVLASLSCDAPITELLYPGQADRSGGYRTRGVRLSEQSHGALQLTSPERLTKGWSDCEMSKLMESGTRTHTGR